MLFTQMAHEAKHMFVVLQLSVLPIFAPSVCPQLRLSNFIHPSFSALVIT